MRNAILSGVITVIGASLILMGVADMQESGRTSSPLLALGLFPAILAPMFLIHYWSKIKVFRDMQNGSSAIARWTMPADEFERFCEEDRRIPARSIMTNFYKPPRNSPESGIEVIFSSGGVLIGGGYFPLSTTGGRRVQSVRYVGSNPPSIEFAMTINTLARTSSATVNSDRTMHKLRVPVASGVTQQASEVVHHYQALIDAEPRSGTSS